MNLHNALFPMRNVAIWIDAVGRNGRGIGTHLWPMEEGQPPEMSPMPIWNTRAYWTASRFTWRPFNTSISTLFFHGYVRPLCGKVSRARRPNAYASSYPGCATCATIARQRDMMALTRNAAMDESSNYQMLGRERLAWQEAGRPDEWPLPAQS